MGQRKSTFELFTHIKGTPSKITSGSLGIGNALYQTFKGTRSLPQIIEPAPGYLGIDDRMFGVTVAKVVLDGPEIGPDVRQIVPATVPEHTGRYSETNFLRCGFQHVVKCLS